MQRTTRLILSITFLFIVTSVLGVAQQTTTILTSGDAVAVQIAQEFAIHNSGGTAVASYAASGMVSRYSGNKEENSPVTLQSQGFYQSRADSQFATGVKSEVRGLSSNGNLKGHWTDETGTHAETLESAYLRTNWFFPVLTPLGKVSDSSLTFTFLGQTSWNGMTVLGVRVTETITSATPPISIATNYYIDAQSYLLLGMTGTLHPENSSTSEIAWEIHYSQYIQFSGVPVPTHLDEYLNGTRVRTITISSAQINPALSSSDIQAQ